MFELLADGASCALVVIVTLPPMPAIAGVAVIAVGSDIIGDCTYSLHGTGQKQPYEGHQTHGARYRFEHGLLFLGCGLNPFC